MLALRSTDKANHDTILDVRNVELRVLRETTKYGPEFQQFSTSVEKSDQISCHGFHQVKTQAFKIVYTIHIYAYSLMLMDKLV